MQRVAFYKKITALLKLLSLIGIFIICVLLYKTLLPGNNSGILSEEPGNAAAHDQSYEITASGTSFKGVSKDLTPYIINAKKAVKLSKDLYHLQDVDGLYSLKSDDLIIRSSNGFLNNASHQIDLEGRIKAFGHGLIISSENMKINLLTEEISGNDKVQLDYKDSTINARQFNIKDHNLIILEGDVKTKLYVP
jgi:hypothetical protein